MSEPPVPLIARTLRGIEWIAAAELATEFGAEDLRLEHRSVECRAALSSGRPAVPAWSPES